MVLNLWGLFQFLVIFEQFSVIYTMLVKTLQALRGFIMFLAVFTVAAFLLFFQIQQMGLFKEEEILSRFKVSVLTTMILFGQYDDMFFMNDGWDGDSNQD